MIKQSHIEGCPGKKCSCRWILDFRPQGLAGPRHRLEFATQRQAKDHEAATRVKVKAGTYVTPARVPLFATAAQLWFVSKAHRRPSHLCSLRTRLDKHLLPRFGTERLDRITPGELEQMRDELQAEGYSYKTVNAIISAASNVFAGAIRRDECSANPCDRVLRAEAPAREVGMLEAGNESDEAVDPTDVLDPSEIARLLKHAEPGLYHALLLTAFETGMRSGELLALSWGDVEFADKGRGRIFVRRSLSRARVGRDEPVRSRFYSPKTRSGIRNIAISAALAHALKLWRLMCPKGDMSLVFPRADGTPNDRYRILRSGLRPALRRAGLREVNFHSLRHSCASTMINEGIPITEVAARLGHCSPQLTLRIYSHYFRRVETDTADKLAAAVLGRSRPDCGQNVGSEPGRIVQFPLQNVGNLG